MILKNSDIKNVILDTDAGPDGDDTAALTMLYHYANMGKIKILATVSDTSSPYGASYLNALNIYYGYRDLPVGTLKSKDNILPTSRGNNFNVRVTADYETDIKDGTLARDALDVYREVLSKAEDKSVIIVATGMQSNIADLLMSESDKWSELSGIELVGKKVDFISAMAGEWPLAKTPEYNIYNDIKAAKYVVENCPVPIIYTGASVGDGVVSGPNENAVESDSPLHIAWWKMNSWDQIAVMAAVEGLKDLWEIKRGDAYIDEKGINAFTENEISGMRYYLVEDEKKDSIIAKEIEKIANAPKKNNLQEKKVKSISASEAKLSDGWTVYKGKEPFWSEGITEIDLKYLHTYKNAITAASSKGETIEVSGEGCEIEIYGSKGINYGGFKIFIDEIEYGICDTLAEQQPLYSSQHLFTINGLIADKHILRLETVDNAYVGIDFIKFIK